MINLKKCSSTCLECIKQYKEKHKVDFKESNERPHFAIDCGGIPKEYLTEEEAAGFSDLEYREVLSYLDPVTWAAENLDWHCLDPDGEIWKRKNPQEYLNWRKKNPGVDILGHSRYHRPYQALILRCRARHKVMRVGRQAGKSEAIVVAMLYHMFVKPGVPENEGFIIVLVTPYQTQIELIFKRITELLQSSVKLQNSIHRSVKAPQYQLELHNNSRIAGFTAGSKSSGGATSVRGQHANMLCLDEGSLVNTGEFSLKPIEKLTLQDTVLGADFDRIEVGEIIANFKREAEVIRISTPLTTLRCTPDHPIFNGREDVPAERAREAIVDLSYRNLSFKQEAIIARLAGYNFGDGWITENLKEAGFSGDEKDLQQILQDIVVLGGEPSVGKNRFSINKELGIEGMVAQIGSRYAVRLLKDICPRGRKVHQQLAVPLSVMNGSAIAKKNFLSGLYSAGGTELRYKKNGTTPCALEIRMNSSKKEFIEKWIFQIVKLLESVGVRVSKVKIKKEKGTINKAQEDRWVGLIRMANSRKNLLRFIDAVGACYSMAKQRAFNAYRLYCWYDSVYKERVWKKNRRIRALGYLKNKETSSALGIPLSTVKFHKKKYHPLFSENKLDVSGLIDKLSIISDGYVLLPILDKHLKRRTLSTVYNLTSTAFHRYFGNGMLTHNCLDEADYLNSDDMDAVMSVVTNYPEALVWMSSTPSGKRDKFFSVCHDMGWKEFHFPSYANPLWNERIEANFRSILTKIAWEHEIEANFSEQELGVFQNAYVDAAKDVHEYEAMVPQRGWAYMMGVDWNDPANGTTISVVGFNPANNNYYKVAREIVQKAGWTQLAACQKIAELNRLWRPDRIYIDKGHGSTQGEILRKWGFEALTDPSRGRGHPDTKLKDLVVYDFGSNVEVRDPWTQKKEKKYAKAFLVENAVRFFESQIIHYPASDKDFAKQLNGYIIKRIGESGKPTYEAGPAGDHMLDAFMLALVAFALETSSLGKPKFDMSISFAPPLNSFPEEGEGKIKELAEGVYHKEGPKEKRTTRPSMKRTGFLDETPALITRGNAPAAHTTLEARKNTIFWGEGKNHLSKDSENGIIRRGLRTRRPRRKNI